jgi:hypothetical protein
VKLARILTTWLAIGTHAESHVFLLEEELAAAEEGEQLDRHRQNHPGGA